MKKIIINTALFTLLLGGCAHSRQWLDAQPPHYAKGYRDGCRSAEKWWENNLADYKVLDKTLKDDPLYKEGWHNGYDRCYGDIETEIWMSRGRFGG
ncbi:MAG: hypothetical protein GXO33_03120 [Epsilonproteobacteria bacterium]|nr:hypothetical protein [Campylobacterota bacterium]